MSLRTLAITAMVGLAFPSCAQPTGPGSWVDVTIDPGIRDLAESAFDTSAFDMAMGRMPKGFIYDNRIVVEMYGEDGLTMAVSEAEDQKTVFKSFYYWHNDTLYIDGAFGLFGGTGFSARLKNNKAEVRNLLASDEGPEFAYTDKAPLVFRLEVPCTDTQLILSEYPDPDRKQPIHGYVAFKSDTFYSSGGAMNGEELPRKAIRQNMRIYFRSMWLNLE